MNLAVLVVAAVLGWRLVNTGGPAMLRAMEASPEERLEMAKDPVCGMTVDPATAAAASTHEGVTHHFCSAGCKAAFDRHPDEFAGKPA